MTTPTKTDVRQLVDRNTLTTTTGVAGSQLDTILTAIDSEITLPFAMTVDGVNLLKVDIAAEVVTNPSTSINRQIGPIAATDVSFSSGSVTFPSTSGGNAVPSSGSSVAITVSSGNFIKVGLSINTSAQIVITPGVQGASAAAATIPALVASTINIGYVLLQNVAGTIQNLTGASISQYTNPSDFNLTNPMTAVGDIIVGGTAGAATRLAHPGAANYVLVTDTTTTEAWSTNPIAASWVSGSGPTYSGTSVTASKSTFTNGSSVLTSTGVPTTITLTGADTGSGFHTLAFQKSRVSGGAVTAIGSSDVIGKLNFNGFDGTSYSLGGQIYYQTTGSVSTGIVPTILRLSTADAAGTQQIGLAMQGAIVTLSGSNSASSVSVGGSITAGTTLSAGTVFKADNSNGVVGIGAAPTTGLALLQLPNSKAMTIGTGPTFSGTSLTASQTSISDTSFTMAAGATNWTLTGYSNSGGSYSSVQVAKAHVSGGAVANVTTSDSIGSYDFLAYNGGFQTVASIRATVDGTLGTGRLDLYGGSGGALTTSALTIGSSTNVIVNNGDLTVSTGNINVNTGSITVANGTNEIQLGSAGSTIMYQNGGSASRANLSVIRTGSGATPTHVSFNTGSPGTPTLIGSIAQTNATTIAYNTTSDRRVKTDIVDAAPMLDRILAVQVRNFRFIADPDNNIICAPIAQEVNEIFPEKVLKDGDGTGDVVPAGEMPWQVNINWTFELIKSIQELKAQLDAATARITELEAK
jgi:hypothetical protein